MSEHTGNPDWPPNPQPPSPEELELPLLQDPRIPWEPEPLIEDDGAGHEFPPEAVQISEQEMDGGSL